MTDGSGPPQSPSFATLAHRISAWTTRGLLTLMVLAAGLGFGRQVLQWWAADAAPTSPQSPSPAAPAGPQSNFSQTQTIEFGDSRWSLRRLPIRGDEALAIKRLRTLCRESLDAALSAAGQPSPPTPLPKGEGTRHEAPLSTGEERLLALLAQEKPVAESAGKWRLYELHENFPMAAGVSWSDAPTEKPRRLLLWGMAVPSSDKAWTACVFQVAGNHSAEDAAASHVPLPPDCHRTLSLRTSDGAAMTGFCCRCPPHQVNRFYSEWAAKAGWQTTVDWRAIGSAWYAKFVAADSDGGVLEVRLGPDVRGGWSGLLMTTQHASR
jgi:hypothetical protein